MLAAQTIKPETQKQGTERNVHRVLADLLSNSTNDHESEHISNDVNNESSSSSSLSFDDEAEECTQASPLFRHETLRPSVEELSCAPLLRHESIGMGYSYHEKPGAMLPLHLASLKASRPPAVSPEADPDDTSLEIFPTSHAAILKHFRKTSARLIEDHRADHGKHDSACLPKLSHSSSSMLSLASVREAEEDDPEQAEAEEDGDVEGLKGQDEEPEDDEFEPKMRITENVVIEERVIVEVQPRCNGILEMLSGCLGGSANTLYVRRRRGGHESSC